MQLNLRSLSVGAAVLLGAGRASATWSVAASDTSTGLVGSAGASCVPYEVIRIEGIAPGYGVIEAQAYFDDPARDEAVALLAEQKAPGEILAIITSPDAHPVAAKMQYGIVDTLGRSAAITGAEALAYAAHRTGTVGDYAYSIQGNLLTSARVLEQAEDSFVASGCDLADKLMLALEAGAANGEGDGRCTPDGRPAKSAFIDVRSASETVLRVSLPDVSPDDPIRVLRVEFDAWRKAHPCPLQREAPSPVEPASCAVSRGPGDARWLVALAALATLRRRRYATS